MSGSLKKREREQEPLSTALAFIAKYGTEYDFDFSNAFFADIFDFIILFF